MNPTTGTFLVLTGLVGAYFVVFGRAHLSAIAGHRAAMTAAYDRFERVELETAQATLLERADAELDRWRDDLDAQLGAAGAPPLLLATTSALKADRLTVERAEAVNPDPSLGRNQRVRVAVTGTFADLFRAVTNIENSLPPTRITELTVQAATDGTSVRGDLLVVRTGGPAR
jgi:hypothetical protein